jgi:hypothetical protein
MTTRVINVGGRDRALLLADPDFVYVGRRTRGWPASPWGNPYRPGPDGTLAEVLARYEHEHLASRPDLLAMLPELRGKVLGCWCHPKPCHADVLARLADEDT